MKSREGDSNTDDQLHDSDPCRLISTLPWLFQQPLQGGSLCPQGHSWDLRGRVCLASFNLLLGRGLDSGVRLPAFNSSFSCLLAVCPWASSSPSLGLTCQVCI